MFPPIAGADWTSIERLALPIPFRSPGRKPRKNKKENDGGRTEATNISHTETPNYSCEALKICNFDHRFGFRHARDNNDCLGYLCTITNCLWWSLARDRETVEHQCPGPLLEMSSYHSRRCSSRIWLKNVIDFEIIDWGRDRLALLKSRISFMTSMPFSVNDASWVELGIKSEARPQSHRQNHSKLSAQNCGGIPNARLDWNTSPMQQ
jgi:hypothetical protein